MSQYLRVKLLDKTAQIPQKGSELAAGYDLFANEDKVVGKQGKALVKTGVAVSVPFEHYGRIAPRSGLAWKHFIDVGAGVIDEDYRGEVGVVLFNHSQQDFPVHKGDRIAQLILEKVSYAQVICVDDLPPTQRGQGGFGSTGVQQLQPQQQPSTFTQQIHHRLEQCTHKGLLSTQQQLQYQNKIQNIIKLHQTVQQLLTLDDDQQLLNNLKQLDSEHL